ncbi:MAG: LacI family DNA-binding transcriptional regulator [Rhodobacteraceae bacterium]|nr:LacI family DNA-binding transcriptional regulator [Paracoccaceae bacterium]
MTLNKQLPDIDIANAGNKRPTLKDIAYLSGLSVTTVSKALNDATDISSKTKSRVQLIAKKVGYRPNRAGIRLRTGKTNVISLILSTEVGAMGMTSPLVTGISDIIGDTNYHLVVTPYDMNQDPLVPVKYVVETGAADGIILSRTEPHDPRVKYLHDAGFPFVTHGRTRMGIEHAFHDFDNTAYAKKSVKFLIDRGRKHIGLIPPPDTLTFAQHMNSGFFSELDRHDLQEMPIRNISIDSTFEEIAAEIERIMRSSHPLDGIVCGSANSAISAIAGIEAAGKTTAADIDLVAKESFEFLSRFRPNLFVIQENFRDAGQHLIKMVLGMIEGDRAEKHQFLEAPGPLGNTETCAKTA